MQHLIAGVDIGGTHITVCLVDISKGRLLRHTLIRRPINPRLDSKDLIPSWASSIRECFLKADVPIRKIGIAMPGPFDYENGISFIKGLDKFENLYGKNVRNLLAEELEINSSCILMMNDASAFLLGELHCGAGIGYDNIVGVTLGTGLGSASFYNGKMHDGNLWNLPYKDGIAEDCISARWLIKTYERLTNKKVSGVKVIAQRYSDDKDAKNVFNEFGKCFGEVLLKKFYDQSPQIIIIGGNIAKAAPCFIPIAQKVLNERNTAILLKPAELGEEAALMGSSYLWKKLFPVAEN